MRVQQCTDAEIIICIHGREQEQQQQRQNTDQGTSERTGLLQTGSRGPEWERNDDRRQQANATQEGALHRIGWDRGLDWVDVFRGRPGGIVLLLVLNAILFLLSLGVGLC